MTVARSQLVDVNVTRWYHTISRCSREQICSAKVRRLARRETVRLGSNGDCKNLTTSLPFPLEALPYWIITCICCCVSMSMLVRRRRKQGQAMCTCVRPRIW